MLIPALKLAHRFWLCKWGIIRFALASSLLCVLVGDNPARLARVGFASLPGMNYLTEVRNLKQQNRFAEALLVAEAGLEEVSGDERAALLSEQQQVRDDQ